MSTTGTSTAVPATALEQEWRRWHAARETELVAEYGWLSLRAFGWLGDEPAVVADLPGTARARCAAPSSVFRSGPGDPSRFGRSTGGARRRCRRRKDGTTDDDQLP